jgi:hypothetical protein
MRREPPEDSPKAIKSIRIRKASIKIEKKRATQEIPQEVIVPVSVPPVLVYPPNLRKKRKPPEAWLRCCWKKGQSGNPKGGHKKQFTIGGVLKGIGDELIETKDRDGNTVKITRREFVLRQAYLAAESGDKDFLLFIAERTEGKVPQKIEADVQGRQTIFNVESEQQRCEIEKGNANADNI